MERLRFVDNDHLAGPLVEHLDVTTRAGNRIGTFDGVLVEPSERRVRYLVVDRGRFFHQRCLIPLPDARIDAEHHAISLDVEEADAAEWQRFDPSTFPPFSDEDLITAMFANRG